MANEKTLEVLLQLKDELSKKLSDTTLKINNFGDEIKSVGKIISTSFAVKQIYDFASASLSAYSEQEIALTKLKTAINNSGNSWDDCSGKVNLFLKKIQETTVYSQEETAESLQDIMFYTDDLNQALEGVALAEDMASSGMFDLSTASRYVGLALQGNTDILGRYIPELKESSNSSLALMSATEKTAYALDLLKSKFGGQAAEEAKTYGGQIKTLNNYFGELKEQIGEVITKNYVFRESMEMVIKSLKAINAPSSNDISQMSEGVEKLTYALEAAQKEVETAQRKLSNAQNLKWWQAIFPGKEAIVEAYEETLAEITAKRDELARQLSNENWYEEIGLNNKLDLSFEAFDPDQFLAGVETEALQTRLGNLQNFWDQSNDIAEFGSTQEFNSYLELMEDMSNLDIQSLESKQTSAKSEILIEQAKNKAILTSTQAMYQYQVSTASNIASIMKSAATISGNSWLDAAAAIVSGLSQVIQLMLQMKALASAGELKFWETAYYVTSIASVVASTAASIASIQSAKKSLNEATVGDLTDSISSAAVGAHIEKGGLLRVHDDEDVIPAEVSSYKGSSDVGSGKIEVHININTAMLNSPSNMKEFVEELMDEIDYLTNRRLGRPRTAF